MGKGDNRRPASVPDEEVARRWEATFSNRRRGRLIIEPGAEAEFMRRLDAVINGPPEEPTE